MPAATPTRPGPRWSARGPVILPGRPRRSAGATVVIPCYRYGHYLRAAVHSALAQRHVDMRVIIVDDASPDDSLAVARDIAAADSRVSVIPHETNQGHIRTYNDGLEAVDTEFVALVSADDLVAPGAFDRAVALLQSRPDVSLAYGKLVRFSDEPLPPARRVGGWRIHSGRAWALRIAQTGWNPIISPEAILRTDVLRAIGPYNPRLPHAADLEYWIRAAAHGRIAQLRGIPQAYYRVHGANMHLTAFPLRMDDLRQKHAAFAALRHLEGGDDILITGLRTLAAEALAAAREAADAASDTAIDFARFAEEISPDEVQRRAAGAMIAQRGGR
nr:glycosyltransferase [Microbacterium sp. dk485]